MTANIPNYGDRIVKNEHATLEFHTFLEDIDSNITQALTATSGARELISTTAITAVSTITLPWDESIYNKIELSIVDMQVGTDDVNIRVRFGHTDGTVIISSANYQSLFNSGLATWTSATGQTEIRITNGTAGNAAGEYVQGDIMITNFASANNTASLESRLNYHNTTGAILDVVTHGRLVGDANIIDAAQLSLSSGNFAAGGTIRLYGYRI